MIDGIENKFDIAGYEISDSNNGFQVSGMDRIGAYIAVKQPAGYGFAFCVGGINAALNGVSISANELENKAKAVIEQYLLAGNLIDREEYTFEYDFDKESFREVSNASWWHKTARK